MNAHLGVWPHPKEIDAYMTDFKTRIVSLKRTLQENPELLSNRPHPTIAGLTLRDYVAWRLKFAGLIGELKALIILEHEERVKYATTVSI